MFERFTDRARRVVVLAQEQARTLHQNYIAPEHIFLGCLAEKEGVAAIVLNELDFDYDKSLDWIENNTLATDRLQMGHIPFTASCKKVLEYSLREALQLGHNYIGTEHILLGIARVCDDDRGKPEEQQMPMTRLLGSASLANLRQAVIDKLKSYVETPSPEQVSTADAQRAVKGILEDAEEYDYFEITRVIRIERSFKGNVTDPGALLELGDTISLHTTKIQEPE